MYRVYFDNLLFWFSHFFATCVFPHQVILQEIVQHLNVEKVLPSYAITRLATAGQSIPAVPHTSAWTWFPDHSLCAADYQTFSPAPILGPPSSALLATHHCPLVSCFENGAKLGVGLKACCIKVTSNLLWNLLSVLSQLFTGSPSPPEEWPPGNWKPRLPWICWVCCHGNSLITCYMYVAETICGVCVCVIWACAAIRSFFTEACRLNVSRSDNFVDVRLAALGCVSQ